MRGVIALGLLLLISATTGCSKKEAQAQPAEELPPHPYVVEGNASVHRPIIHLHGMCADPKEDLDAWGGVAKEHGTIIAVMGDVPCPAQPGRFRWTSDAAAIDRRIDDAVRTVSEARGLQLDTSEMIVIGESMGAARAELLASKFPEKYSRVVLVGSPQKPSPQNLKAAKAVANLAGEKEPQNAMRAGTRALESAGTPTRFWEIPKANHGDYGPDGERIMNEALSFVSSR